MCYDKEAELDGSESCHAFLMGTELSAVHSTAVQSIILEATT